MIYLELFLSFLKIGIFGFGGGYSILALIQYEIVEKNQFISLTEFTDITAISQVTPGPIAINAATYVGYVATDSILGAAVATIAVCLPPIVLVGLVCYFAKKLKDNAVVNGIFYGIRPCVVGLLASAAIMLATKENFIDLYSYVIFAVVGGLSLLKVNPIFLITLSGIAGYFLYSGVI